MLGRLVRLEAVPLQALGTGSAGNIVQLCNIIDLVFRLVLDNLYTAAYSVTGVRADQPGVSTLGEDKR